ncbi:MAG: hypothetical protein ACKVU4_08030 [Phycisphaerales bacterium]
MSESTTIGNDRSTTPTPAPRGRRWKRRITIGIGLVLVVLLIVVGLAPTIAGWIAPGYAAGAIAGAINGSATVDRVSLSWFGKQKAGDVTIRDAAGQEVARVGVEISRSLWSLARGAIGLGSLDAGEVRVTGRAVVVREADGTLNVSKLFKGSGASGASSPTAPGTRSKPGDLPPSLAATLVLDNLEVAFVDRAPDADPKTRAVRLKNVRGGGSFAVGRPATFTLTADASSGPDADGAGTPAGTLEIKATVDGIADATGRRTPDLTTFDATITATGLALAPADALARMNGALVEGFGERVTLTVSASGSAREATAQLKAAADGLDADLAVRYTNAPGAATITATRPGSLRLRTAGLRRLAPGLHQAMEAQDLAEVTRWPEVRVAVEQLSFLLPANGATSPDLRGAAASVKIETGDMAGTVVTPGPDGATTGPRQPFSLAPMTFTLASSDLGGSLRFRADGSATVGGQPAGTLVVDLSADGLLDASGRPIAGPPRTVRGTVLVKGVSTSLAGPLVAPLGIDLPNDVGPHVDVDLRAAARAGEPGGASSAIPSTDVDLEVRGAKFLAQAAVTVDERGVRGRDTEQRPAVEVRLASAGAIASRFAEKSGAAKVGGAGGGGLRLTVSGIDVPLAPGTRAPALDTASASAKLSWGGFNILPLPAHGPRAPIQLKTLEFVAVLAPGAPPHITLDAAMLHAESPFAFTADLAIENLFAPGAGGGSAVLALASARPVGTFELTDLPASLARLFPAAPATPAKPAINLAALLENAVGKTVSVTAETSIARQRADRLNAKLSFVGTGLTVSAAGGWMPERVAVDTLDVRALLTPALAEDVLAAFAPTLQPRPRLAGPATLRLSVDPIRVALVKGTNGGTTFDLAGAGDLAAKLALDGRLIAQGLSIKNADGSARDLGPVGLEGLEAALTAPIAALLPGTTGTHDASISLKALALSGPASQRLGDLDFSARVALAAGAPAGSIATTLKLTDIRAAGLEPFLQQPGLLTGALGETVSLDAAANIQLPPPGSAGVSGGNAFERVTLTAGLTAPRLTTPRPLKASLTPGTITIDSPMIVHWTMTPAFANRFALGQAAPTPGTPAPPAPPGPPAKEPSARFTEPTRFTVSVYKLGLAAGDAPMKPGVFALDAAIEAPLLTLAVADGTPARFETLKVRASAGQQPGSIGFSLKMDAAGAPNTGAAGAPVDASGGIYQLSDDQGRLTMDRAVLTAKAGATGFPTAIADAFARQRGLLIEALGPTMTLAVEASGVALSKTGDRGKLDATFSSPRADANLKGVVRDGRFIAQGPVTVNLAEITSGLGERLVNGLPAVGVFEKRREDGPASLTAVGLTLPVDGDLRKLNGDLTLKFGLVRFETGGSFAGILRRLGQRDQGSLGRRVEPFHAVIKDGVMFYERYTLPLGEFTVDTEGSVDLAERRMDVVTYIPLGALSDEAAGRFNTGLGKLFGELPLLDRATMLPWRTSGTFDGPRTEPDLELFIKQIGSGLNPLKLLPGLKPGGR